MGGKFYETDAGDTWDCIAWRVYGNESYMGILMEQPENAHLLLTTIFSAGEKVWCPEIEEEEIEEDIPEWRDSE